MKQLKITQHGPFLIGSSNELTEADLEQLAEALRRPAQGRAKLLGGRGLVSYARLASIGPVVIKHYKRGGALRYVNSRHYLRCGALRPETEFRLLSRVREFGLRAPEPVAFAEQGRLLYKGWLLTKEIENQQTLAEISLADEERLARVMRKFVAQVALLVQHRIYHVDLHPGNVLVDAEDNVYLLDFDKARLFKHSKNRLRDRYLCRWRRAVIKHKLPEVASELLCVELRKNYERE